MESLNTRRLIGASIFALREAAQSYQKLSPEEQKELRRDMHQTHGQFSHALFDHAFIQFCRLSLRFPLKGVDDAPNPVEEEKVSDHDAKTDGAGQSESSEPADNV